MKRISPSLIISVLALIVALSGSAYAAAKINGANIKSGTVTSKQIKNGTISKADLSKRLSLRGPAGPAGPGGKDGIGVLDGTLASGRTMTGLWSFAPSNPTANMTQIFYKTIEFPVKAPQKLLGSDVNFKAATARNTDDDASCIGSATQPTAPPGKVCIYTASETYYNLQAGISGEAAPLADSGFVIKATVDPGDWIGYGSWAYTAP